MEVCDRWKHLNPVMIFTKMAEDEFCQEVLHRNGGFGAYRTGADSAEQREKSARILSVRHQTTSIAILKSEKKMMMIYIVSILRGSCITIVLQIPDQNLNRCPTLCVIFISDRYFKKYRHAMWMMLFVKLEKSSMMAGNVSF